MYTFIFIFIFNKNEVNRVLITVMAFASIGAWGQNTSTFTSQCISKNETGFNWERNWWVSMDYRPGKIFLVKKLDHSETAFKGKEISDTPNRCKNIEDRVYDLGFFDDGDKAREACYSIKAHGSTESLFFNAEKCNELYDKTGKLKEVQCTQMRFAPDGLFIRLPWESSMNLNPYPDKGEKDSLNLSVGTCSRLN